MMNRYLQDRLFKFGFWLFVIGVGPLLAIVLLAGIRLWPDPNPNPVGPGLLAALSFWPALICMGIGAFRVWRQRH